MGEPSTGEGETAIVSAAVALGALSVRGVCRAETRLASRAAPIAAKRLGELRDALMGGEDPLGEMLCALRSAETRRAVGATYTPAPLVEAMLARVDGVPARVVDPGSGSGRLVVAAAARFPDATLVAIERDPLAALMTRAALACAGVSDRAEVRCEDFRRARLPKIGGRTLYLANPPYVRHHAIDARWKAWLVTNAARRGVPRASQLAGLHVHFFLATLSSARPGDLGVFLTSSEWLDVNYGAVVRALLVGPLGGKSVHIVDAGERPFPDATTTAAITSFEIGRDVSTMGFADVVSLARIPRERTVSRAELMSASRWRGLVRAPPSAEAGMVALGEICRVHRGAVTGCNAVFVVGADAPLPPRVLFPAITRAKELFVAGPTLASDSHLRRVVDLPMAFDDFTEDERSQITRFIEVAKSAGVERAYVARARRAWWSVGLRAPAPILATYMARRPPTFVRNVIGARHVNIAHGLYPRFPLDDGVLCALARFLCSATSVADGRTYAGGLTKFEPKEMERLLVPRTLLEHGRVELDAP